MRTILRTSAFTAALAVAALAALPAAHAGGDVRLTIGVNSPGWYVQPAPVYVQPAPVYVQPRPVYAAPQRVYVAPTYGYVPRGGAWGDLDRDGIPNRYDRDYWRRYQRAHGPNGDLDHDGIPNAYDRDRDGDGIPNRWDRRPEHRSSR